MRVEADLANSRTQTPDLRYRGIQRAAANNPFPFRVARFRRFGL